MFYEKHRKSTGEVWRIKRREGKGTSKLPQNMTLRLHSICTCRNQGWDRKKGIPEGNDMGKDMEKGNWQFVNVFSFFLDKQIGVELVSLGRYMFYFLRNCQTPSWSRWLILHFQQQLRILVALDSHQHLVVSVLKYFSHWSVWMSHCAFNLNFHDDKWC